MENFKIMEVRIWGMLSILIILAWGITVGKIYDTHKDSERAFLSLELERFEGEFNSTLKTYEEFSNYIFDEIEQDEEIISIINQANLSSDEEKKILRNRLYKKFSEHYPRMQKYKFRQLHFHLSNTESFLRVHQPEKYGDILLESRESVRLTNENKINTKGFEEGKIFNGFRNVYPLKYNNKHIGSVEISMSSVSVIEILSQLHMNSDFYFIIDKTVFKETLFKDQMDNYRESSIFEGYYVDIEVDNIISKSNLIETNSKKLFFQNIKDDYKEQIKDKQSFAAITKFQGRDYIVKFLAIKNLKQSPSSYLISISEKTGNILFIENMYKEIILVTILAFIIIGFGLILAFYHYRLRKSAELDSLTKIYNRDKFYEIASREINRAKRFKEDLFVMFMDIDFFKDINDTYGHERGDKVLKNFTLEISSNIREFDVFARWGGEEFVLLLPNTNKEKGIMVAEKIRKLIEDSRSEELRGITISVGVTLVDSENYDITDAINLADQAMYEAKRKGRNQICFK